MTKSQMQRYRKQLEKLHDRIRSDASTSAEQARGGFSGKSGGELTNVPLHLGDMGTEEFLQDLNATLAEHEGFLANEVRDAISRMKMGTYGVCEGCGQNIKPERLDAIPYTRYCVQCAESHEAEERSPSGNLNEGRPRGPADTLAPEGDMGEDVKPKNRRRNSSSRRVKGSEDTYAAGTAGGGTALGGLAGSNSGHGDPEVSDLQEASGSGNFDAEDDRGDKQRPQSGRSGGAVGGTPARKRAT